MSDEQPPDPYQRGEWFEVGQLPDGQVVSAREIHVPDEPWWAKGVELVQGDRVARWVDGAWVWDDEETT